MKKRIKRRDRSTKIKHSAGRPTHPVAKERLLKVALTLFSQKGYSAVSIREIAKKANVNAANISYHFGSKFGLYKAIFEKVLNSRQEELVHFENDHKVSCKQKAICRVQMITELMEREPQIINLLFRILLTEPDKKIREVVTRKFLPPLCENIFEIIGKARIDTKFKFVDSENLASFVIAVKAFWFLFADDFAHACPQVKSGKELIANTDEALTKLMEAVLIED